MAVWPGSASCETWKQFLTWIWIDCNQNLKPKAQSSCKWNANSESHVETIGKLLFWLNEFLSNLPLKIIIHCVNDQPFTTCSLLEYLSWITISHFTFFLRLMIYLMSIDCNCVKMHEEKFQFQFTSYDNIHVLIVSIKVLLSRTLVYLSLILYAEPTSWLTVTDAEVACAFKFILLQCCPEYPLYSFIFLKLGCDHLALTEF